MPTDVTEAANAGDVREAKDGDTWEARGEEWVEESRADRTECCMISERPQAA